MFFLVRRLLKNLSEMSSQSLVFHSTIGPLHNFHQRLPKDCSVLHVIVIGEGHGLSLYFKGQDQETHFVIPLFEGLQSVCTTTANYTLSTWWTGGVSLHSYEWLSTTYPAGHYCLRFVYRRPHDGILPKLSTYAWSVVRANRFEGLLPLSLQRRDPLGLARHCVTYTRIDCASHAYPTCTPKTCAYYHWYKQQL
jgi:hypothetical protein